MRLTIFEIADCLGAPCLPEAANVAVTGVSIDSRKVKQGDLFVCLPGERVDGHDFAAKAIENGASAVLAQKDIGLKAAPVIQVENTEKALGKLAHLWRSRFKGAVIAITGTAGKTTCKEALAAILRLNGKTAATQGNHNNQIGLPLTILNTDGDEKYWVLEAGISHPGDMEYLGAISEPNLAIILNVGAGHEEGLGKKGVAWHKAQIFRHLAPGGVALVNQDYPELLEKVKSLKANAVFFSVFNSDCPYYANEDHGQPGMYNINLKNHRIKSQTPMRGEAGAENAIAAASAASLLGLDDLQIVVGLAKMKLAPHRGEIFQYGNIYIFDASYNANPVSMEAMLNNAFNLAQEKKLPFICVLGEMRELGDNSEKEHSYLGFIVSGMSPAAVFWKGELFEKMRIFINSHPDNARPIPVIRLDDPQKLANDLLNLPRVKKSGAVILVQGSRANRLEEYVEALKAALTAEGDSSVL